MATCTLAANADLDLANPAVGDLEGGIPTIEHTCECTRTAAAPTFEEGDERAQTRRRSEDNAIFHRTRLSAACRPVPLYPRTSSTSGAPRPSATARHSSTSARPSAASRPSCGAWEQGPGGMGAEAHGALDLWGCGQMCKNPLAVRHSHSSVRR